MRPYELTLRDEDAIGRLPEIKHVTAELARSDLYEVSQWSNTSAHLGGNQPSYTVVRYLPIAAGRFIDDAGRPPGAPRRLYRAKIRRRFSFRAIP